MRIKIISFLLVLILGGYVLRNSVLAACSGSITYSRPSYTCGYNYLGSFCVLKQENITSSCGSFDGSCGVYDWAEICSSNGTDCSIMSGTVWHACSTGGGGPAPTSPPSGGGGGSDQCSQQGGFCVAALPCPAGYWHAGYTCNSGLCCYRSPDAASGRCTTQSWYVNGLMPPVDLRTTTNITYLCDAFYGSSPPWPNVTISGGRYNWICYGQSGASNASCSALADSPPVLSGVVIKNGAGSVVGAESGNRNQICQSAFNNNRYVIFDVNVSDVLGISDVSNVTLTWNGINIPRISAIGATTVFGYDFTGYNSPNVAALVFTATDNSGQTGTDSSRSFKAWDCKVPVSGSFYDGSNVTTCSSTSFTTLATKEALNFSSLIFKGSGVDVGMNVNTTTGNSYSSGSNYLTWGVSTYVPDFNDNINTPETAVTMRTITASNTSNCVSYLNTNNVNPYNSNVGITADFLGVIDQEPWWQANGITGGGVMANNKVDGQRPVTCRDSFTCLNSVGSLISAPTVNNIGPYQLKYYSGIGAKLASVNNNYDYFYNQYYVKNGSGKVFSVGASTSTMGSLEAVNFINGDLTINSNATQNSGFLMFVVKGKITVLENVDTVYGILVANGIEATGKNIKPLVFTGSLYSANNIDFNRGFATKSENNTKPAVVVNYSPNLVFSMPGGMARVLSSWQWGN